MGVGTILVLQGDIHVGDKSHPSGEGTTPCTHKTSFMCMPELIFIPKQFSQEKNQLTLPLPHYPHLNCHLIIPKQKQHKAYKMLMLS